MNAVRVSASAFGVLCSLTGIIAGVFLMQQGDMPAETIKISTIGPGYSQYEHHTYLAYTLIPDYFISGLVTLIISLAVLVWSLLLIHKPYGSAGFLALSVAQLLTGGGLVIDLALIAFLLSLCIRKVPPFLHKVPGNRFGDWLIRLWFPSLWLYSALALVMLVLSIAGMDHPGAIQWIDALAALMFVPILLMIAGSLAREALKSQNHL